MVKLWLPYWHEYTNVGSVFVGFQWTILGECSLLIEFIFVLFGIDVCDDFGTLFPCRFRQNRVNIEWASWIMWFACQQV